MRRNIIGQRRHVALFLYSCFYCVLLVLSRELSVELVNYTNPSRLLSNGSCCRTDPINITICLECEYVFDICVGTWTEGRSEKDGEKCDLFRYVTPVFTAKHDSVLYEEKTQNFNNSFKVQIANEVTNLSLRVTVLDHDRGGLETLVDVIEYELLATFPYRRDIVLNGTSSASQLRLTAIFTPDSDSSEDNEGSASDDTTLVLLTEHIFISGDTDHSGSSESHESEFLHFTEATPVAPPSDGSSADGFKSGESNETLIVKANGSVVFASIGDKDTHTRSWWSRYWMIVLPAAVAGLVFAAVFIVIAKNSGKVRYL